MDVSCKYLNPLQRDGTSQRQRLPVALQPSYVSVDERSTTDLLQYVLQYAKLLQYYTETNNPGGDWEAFVKYDISVLITEIAAFDHKELKKRFQTNWETVLNTSGTSKEMALAQLFLIPVEISNHFDRWHRRSIQGLSLHSTLIRLIKSVLNDGLRNLLGFAARAREMNLTVEQINTDDYNDIWELSGILPDASLFSSGAVSDEEIEQAAEKTAYVFDRMYEALVIVVQDSSVFFNQTLEAYPEHQPHMALLLAFLKLFSHAQDHLNTITAEHLRFYYEQVLQLEHKPETPDKVHLVFELAKHTSSHRVAKDTLLKAGKDNKGIELFYGVDDDIAVNRATLDDKNGLKNVYIDKYRDNTAKQTIVKNIYAATDADSADGKGAAIEDEDGKWLTFGGRKMPYAKIGFAVASPMFFLSEGTRKVTLRFELEKPTDFLAGESLSNVEKELKHNVKVFASGEKEWLAVTVKETAISLGTGGSKSFVSYLLDIGADIAPVTAYNSKVLDGGFDTKWPVFRFILDNEGLSAKNNFDYGKVQDIELYSDQKESFSKGTLVRYDREVYEAIQPISKPGFRPSPDSVYWQLIPSSYPYKYFQRMEIKRLVIKTDVQGVQNLILENDIGTLNPAKPFHPFGPIARSKSSFLIGSGEIFQKSLKKLTAHIQWAGLPSENFKSYYDKYETNDDPTESIVKGNEYFLATCSILKGREWKDTVCAQEFAVLEAHTGAVHSVAFSPDYERIVTASADGTAIIWGDDKKKKTVLKGHKDEVYSAAFSPPDGKLIVTASADKTAIIWDGMEKTVLNGHRDKVYSAAFSSDSKRIVTASGDGTMMVWDVNAIGKPIVLSGHTDKVYSAVFSPNGKYIVSASEDQSARVWDVAERNELAAFGAHTATVKSVACHSDGKRMVSGGGDNLARQWEITDKHTLFVPLGIESAPNPSRIFSWTLYTAECTRNPRLKSFSQYDSSLRQGFFRFQLITDFLHSLYPRLLAAGAASGDKSNIPNEPYTPLMASLTLDYLAEETIDFQAKKKDDDQDRIEQIFQIWPFGRAEVFPITDDPTADDILIDRRLVPEFKVTVKQPDGTILAEDAAGTLYIGIDNLVPPQNLSTLFQVAEGSEDPQLPAQEVMWSYLSNNRWMDFKPSEVIADKTNGLLTSGVIKLALPKVMTDTDTIMPAKLHWIKASVRQHTAAVSQMIAIHPQAAVASFRNQGNDPAHLSKPLKAGTISKLKSRSASIKSITQPYASFGGRMKEKDQAFQIRVSERLRHKARAISIFDYERLILEKFPQIYKVKCINHTSNKSEYAPGSVLVIVVPDLRNKNAVDPLHPRVSKNTLEEIKAYLSGIASDFIAIDALAPEYEDIQVNFKVRFMPGRDKGLFTALLNDDIKKFLSPWLYDDAADLKFGGRVHRSQILKYVEEREYVDFVTDFRLDQTVDCRGIHMPDIEEAVATTSSSVLVSAPEHLIDPDIKSCEDAQNVTAGKSLS